MATKQEWLKVRVESSLLRELRKLAAADGGRTIASIVRKTLSEAVERQKESAA